MTVVVNEVVQTVEIQENNTTVEVQVVSETVEVKGGILGPGVAAGGTTGQYLRKNSNGEYDTYWDTLDISTADITGVLPIANGGTNADNAADARANLSAAILGANNDITSMTGVTAGISTPDYVDFDLTANPTLTTGRLAWNSDDGTLDIGLNGGSILQVGQEQVFYAKNTSGGQITIGTACMFTGTVGNSGKLTFGKAVSNGTVSYEYMMGIATQTSANNDFTYVTTFGLIRGFNTTGSTKTVPEVWAEGDLLYFDPVHPGELTKNQPSAPAFHSPIAVVVNAGSGGSGSIFVRMKTGESLTELHDVKVNGTLVNNAFLVYDSADSRWENRTPSESRTALGLGSIATQNADNVSITGGSITGIADLAIADGGTGASTAQDARNNLLPTQSTNAGKYLKTDGTNVSWDDLDISTADITGTLPIANGGTGATTATDARDNLGLEIGVDVQPYDATILKSADIGVSVQAYDADTAKYDDATANFTGTLQNGGSNVLVDTDIGSTVQGYDADTAKYDDATANFTGTLQNGGSNVLVNTDIGSTVQAYDAGLQSISGLTTAADKMIYTTAADTYAVTDLTSAGRALLDDADASAQRTTLGLGTIATQDADSVNIDGGAIDNTAIGATTPSTGNFTTLTTQELNVVSVASFAWKTNQNSPGALFVKQPVTLTKAHLGMRRCLLLDNGTVNYYLDPQDSTKKADGTAADLTGADGMVMVEIPKFYTRRVVEGTIVTWYVADDALPGFTVHPAFIKDGIEVDNRYYGAYDACYFEASSSTYKSGLNLDALTVDTTNDKLASVAGVYPIVGVTRATCRSLAANRGTGWRQLDFTLWSAVQFLYLTEFQSFFSQNILGAGNTNGSYLTSSSNQNDSPHTIAGASNFMGNMSTNTVTGAGVNLKPGTSFMCYRGIENFYGNCWNWADGINVNVTANGNVHVTNNAADFADNISTNMTLVATTLPTASGFISALQAIDDYFLSSSNSGGSATTFITDQLFASTSSNRVVRVGGNANVGAGAGAFCVVGSSDSSGRDRAIGARLCW